jgi:hypothetical protein
MIPAVAGISCTPLLYLVHLFISHGVITSSEIDFLGHEALGAGSAADGVVKNGEVRCVLCEGFGYCITVPETLRRHQ